MLDASNAGYIDLAHALRAGWIEFWYQPKIDLRDRQIVGVEMFARARHPFHGPISAAVILQDASDTLLMQLAVFSLRWALQASAVIGLVVETQCRYFKPIAFPDVVHAGIRVAKLGRSSVRYEIGLFANDDDSAAAQGYFVHVYVDRASSRPVPIPDGVRRVLAALMRSP